VIDFKRSPGKTSIPVPADLDGPASDIILSASLVTPPDQELRIHIREILQSMDRRHRILLILSVVGRLTIADISHKFGWPEGTVSRLRAEAQKIFREKLMQREDFKSPLRQRLVDSGE
jgi:DNA-directed RNA polymerase specialized sigma24 family protein